MLHLNKAAHTQDIYILTLNIHKKVTSTFCTAQTRSSIKLSKFILRTCTDENKGVLAIEIPKSLELEKVLISKAEQTISTKSLEIIYGKSHLVFDIPSSPNTLSVINQFPLVDVSKTPILPSSEFFSIINLVYDAPKKYLLWPKTHTTSLNLRRSLSSTSEQDKHSSSFCSKIQENINALMFHSSQVYTNLCLSNNIDIF